MLGGIHAPLYHKGADVGMHLLRDGQHPRGAHPDRGASLALSAYSAVMLRKRSPVHTNRMDGIVFTA
jgi:hypothetical protein